jgi:hypothetical protein
VDPAELEDLAVWATGRLRPDVSVLLDRAPPGEAPPSSGLAGEEHVRVRRLLTHMAAAEPHRYVVVDADASAEEVAERVAAGLTPLLPPAPITEAITAPTPLPPHADQATVAMVAAPGHSSADTAALGADAPRQPERPPRAQTPPPGTSRSGADTGPIRRAAPTRATRSTADTAPLTAPAPARSAPAPGAGAGEADASPPQASSERREGAP